MVSLGANYISVHSFILKSSCVTGLTVAAVGGRLFLFLMSCLVRFLPTHWRRDVSSPSSDHTFVLLLLNKAADR